MSSKHGLDPSYTESNLDCNSSKKPLLDLSIEAEKLSFMKKLELVNQERKLLTSCPPVIPDLALVEVSEEPNGEFSTTPYMDKIYEKYDHIWT